MTDTRSRILGGATGLAAAVAFVSLGWMTARAAEDDVVFTDAETQTAQFIEWYQTIELTPEQEAVKREALTAIPAPCCSDNTAYTCCCPCNMSKATWGLTAHLITEHGADAEAVRAKVQEWIAFINPNGFSGEACYTGGCMRPMAQDGCGGMQTDRQIF